MQLQNKDVSRRSLLMFSGSAALVVLAGCSDDAAPDPFTGGGQDALESPMLTELVESGELPELAERLPTSPMVVETLDGPGTFGGTLSRAQTDPTHPALIQSFAVSGLLEWTWDRSGYLPSLAESYEKDETNTTYTFVLREGLKWSDGEPFTTDDLLFTAVDCLSNETLTPAPPYWFSDIDGGTPAVEVVDERTFTITFAAPFGLFEKYMCHPGVNYQFLKPKHYLSQFHPDYTDPDDVDAATSEAGFDSWDQYFADRDNLWTNSDRPVLGAFKVTEAANAQSGAGVLERNPYYWKTDQDGRQLPYMDKIQVQVLEQDALDLRAANGDLDFQGYNLGYNSAQVYLQNAETRAFQMLRWSHGRLLTLCPNLSHQNQGLRTLLEQVDFRAALSHAIDREEMNTALMGGLAPIRHPLATEDSEYYVEGGGQRFISYDVAKANSLLDGLGLELGSDGVRRRPDGEPLQLVVMYVDSSEGVPVTDALVMVQRAWAEIGVDLSLRPVDNTLYAELRRANDFDLDATPMPSDDFDLEPVWYIPTAPGSHTAPGYGQWYASDGSEGMEPTEEFQALMDNWDALRSAETDEDRIAAGRAVVAQHDEKVYAIGLIGVPFQPVIVADDVRGVRDDSPPLSFYYGREAVTKPEQISFSSST